MHRQNIRRRRDPRPADTRMFTQPRGAHLRLPHAVHACLFTWFCTKGTITSARCITPPLSQLPPDHRHESTPLRPPTTLPAMLSNIQRHGIVGIGRIKQRAKVDRLHPGQRALAKSG